MNWIEYTPPHTYSSNPMSLNFVNNTLKICHKISIKCKTMILNSKWSDLWCIQFHWSTLFLIWIIKLTCNFISIALINIQSLNIFWGTSSTSGVPNPFYIITHFHIKKFSNTYLHNKCSKAYQNCLTEVCY